MVPKSGAVPGLDVVEREPFNAETPAEALLSELTPNGLFYVREHFRRPEGPVRLRVTGAVERELDLELESLRAMGTVRMTVTLECAGNGRKGLEPRVAGTPWGERAVSTARFAGVPLTRVLEEAVPRSDAVEALFSGADSGAEAGRTVRYERSLDWTALRESHPIVAWEMNGEPLPREHGGPLRLVVGGWYGMASVKWLAEVRLLAEPFAGWFQKDRYVYDDEDGRAPRPVTRMRVRSLVLTPEEGRPVAAGKPFEVAGRAWSGEAPIHRVEISTDGGGTWSEAQLEGPGEAGLWTLFRARVRAPAAGPFALLSRATDEAGNVQPATPYRNRFGYGNNATSGPTLRAT